MKTKMVALAEVKAAQTEDPNGAFEAILSVDTIDRDNEVVQKGAFGTLPAHIPIDIDHGLTVASTIGSGVPYMDGDVVKIKGTFSSIPRAQEVRTLVTEGHITTMSVAFLPKVKIAGKAAGDPTIITKAELLNAAFVSVPANRDALVLSSKAGARNSKSDAAHVQTIHDSAANLGADCSGMKSAHGLETKAVAGSYEDRQEDIREALAEFADADIAAAYPDSPPGERGWMVHIVATFDDHVVYQIGWDDDDALSVTYTWDGEEVTITGTAEPVTVDQVVTPATPDPENAPAKAAPSPASKAADAPTDAAGEQEAMRARALVLVASATAAAV